MLTIAFSGDSPSNMPDSPNTVTPIVTKPKSEGKVADATTKNDADPLKGDPKDNVLRKTKHSHFNPVIKLNKVDDSSNELVPIRWTGKILLHSETWLISKTSIFISHCFMIHI